MIPHSNCPHCSKSLWDDKPLFQPKPGMYALCIYCGNALRFTKNLRLVKPKHIPKAVLAESEIAKYALKIGISIEQFVKDELIKEGHIHSH